jgi:hypothetical protein
LSEGAGESTETKFFGNVCTDCVGMKICTWKIGRSESLIERSEIANGKAICELEREFWVSGEKLRAFEKNLEVESRIWSLNFCIVMIIVIRRRFFYLKVVKVDVR